MNFKLLYSGIVLAFAVATMLLRDIGMLRWVVLVAVPLLFYLVATRKFPGKEHGKRDWSLALFSLAYLVLLFVFPNDRWLIGLPMAILAVGGAASGVAGRIWGRNYFSLTGDRKSWAGTIAFLIAVPVVTATFFMVFYRFIPETLYFETPFWFVLAGIAIMLAALEALGSRGFENLYIPLGAAALFWRLPDMLAPGFQPLFFNACIPLAFAFAAVSMRKGWLKPDGAVTASFTGLWVTYFVGFLWLLPLLFFFISSTILGRLAPNTHAVDAKHGKARDARQVLCNGGIFAVLAVFAGDGNEYVLSLMATSLAVCISDTWASEIGLVFRQKTYDILRFRQVPPGLSGGISFAGTLGGMAGALAMALFCNLLIFNSLNIVFVTTIASLGTFGMLLDSVLGASLQARYSKNEKESDVEETDSRLVHGKRWFDNDVVNVVSNAIVVGLSVSLFVG